MTIALLASGTILACGYSLPAAAQSDETYDLGTIVFEMRGAEPVGDNADPLTLSGIKAATPITEVPQSVSVIGQEDIAKLNANKVDRALVGTAGVQSQLYGYDSDTNWFYLRGFNAFDTGAYLDGLSLFSYGFGTYFIDPFQLERIEVLKGPSSMLYGASSPGGVVNYASKLPDGSDAAAVEFGADSEGRAWLSGEVAGLLDETLAYRFGGKVTRQDGHGMFDPGWEGSVFGGATKAFDDGGKLTVHLSYQSMDEDHVGGQFLPYFGTEAAAPFGYFDTYYNGGEADADTYERDQLILTGIYRRDIGGWQMTDTARIGYADVTELYVYPYGFTSGQIPDASAEINRFVFAHDSYARIMQNDLRLTRSIDAGAARHDVLVGLDARQYRLDEEQAFAVGTPLSATDPVYGTPQPTSLFTYIDRVQTQSQVGLYAQDQIRWGDGWLATVNGRYDKVWSDVDDNLGDDLDRTDEAFSYRLALSKTIGDFTPYATYGTYFNPQLLSTASLDADPETGRQFEAGVKWAPNEYTLVSVSAFDIRREDVSQDEFNGAGYSTTILGELRSRGFEIEAKARLSDEWSVRAAYTDLDVDITDFDADTSLVGNTPQSVVETFGSVQFAYAPLSVPGLELRLGARYQGAGWADNANTLKVGDAWLYDAGATYDFEGNWTANLDVSNLADTRYTASCQTSFGVSSCWQGEGRVVSLSLRRSF